VVVLDGKDEVRAALAQPLGGGPLGVESIGGDDHAGQLHLGQQLRQHRDLVGLGGHIGLCHDQAAGVGHRGQQVDLPTLAVLGAAYRLAIHRHPAKQDRR